MKKKVDYIIVGHGITGAVLSKVARERSASVLVFDQAKKNQSSSVAVGLFHPMAFRKTQFSWMGLEVFNQAFEFYSKYYSSLVNAIPLYRIFSDTEEYNRWFERSGEKAYSSILQTPETPSFIKAQHDIGSVLSCAKLQVQDFLHFNQKELEKGDSYYDGAFPYHLVDLTTNSVLVDDIEIEFKHIVFCEGLGVSKNPFFADLKFHPAKGDVLKIELGEKIPMAINKKHFIAPDKGNVHWLGATYNWKNIDYHADKKAAEELLETAASFLKLDIELKEHLYGIRPASFDRRPYVGQHSEKTQLACINGMGSKAVMLAPYCAELLLDAIEGDRNIPKELSLERLNKFGKN